MTTLMDILKTSKIRLDSTVEWCGKTFRNSVDCLESIRDEVFDCDITMDHIVES